MQKRTASGGRVTRTAEEAAAAGAPQAPSVRAKGEPRLAKTTRTAEQDAAAYLRNYPVQAHVRFLTLTEAIRQREEMPEPHVEPSGEGREDKTTGCDAEPSYLFAFYCLRLYDVVSVALSSGWRDPSIGEQEARHGIFQMLAQLRRRQSQYLHEFAVYTHMDAWSKWTQLTTLFMIQCKLMILLDCLCGAFRDSEAGVLRFLQEEALLVGSGGGEKVSSLTQLQLYDLMHSLAAQWNGLRCQEGRLATALSHLQLRAAWLVCRKHPEATMDGLDKKHRLFVPSDDVARPGGEALFRASGEYISDMTCWFAYLYRSLEVMRLFGAPRPNLHLTFEVPMLRCVSHDGRVSPEQARVTFPWCGYDPGEALPRMRAWFEAELRLLLKGRFKDALKAALNKVCLRAGEPQRYARANGGTYASNTASVLEATRTPHEVTGWGETFRDEESLLRVLHTGWDAYRGGASTVPEGLGSQYLGLLHGVLLAKIFDSHWQRKSNAGGRPYTWIVFNLLLEEDVFTPAGWRHITHRGRSPLVLQCMGEFSVYHRGTLYRTVSAERALLLWCAISCERRRCRFLQPFAMERWDLGLLRTLLQAWCPEGYAARLQHLKRKLGRRQRRAQLARGPRVRELSASDSDSDDSDNSDSDSETDSEAEEREAMMAEGEGGDGGEEDGRNAEDPMEGLTYLFRDEPADAVLLQEGGEQAILRTFTSVDTFQ